MNPKTVDIEGRSLPTLVYVAREKRPQYFHNFKAGALNAMVKAYQDCVLCHGLKLIISVLMHMQKTGFLCINQYDGLWE